MNLRECDGEDLLEDDNGDYEIWRPSGKITKECLMGHSLEFSRKKRDSKCYNSLGFERMKFIKDCDCSKEDF